jgi:hypothetical protein
MMLTIVLIFLGVDVYYIVWTKSIQFKFPKDIAENITKALLGFSTSLKVELYSQLKRLRSPAPNNNYNDEEEDPSTGKQLKKTHEYS